MSRAPPSLSFFSSAGGLYPESSSSTFDGGFHDEATWTHDGTRLACTTKVDNRFQIATIDTITGDRTLYAAWTPVNSTVTFDSQGGSAVSSQTVGYGGLVTEPTDPTRIGDLHAGAQKIMQGLVDEYAVTPEEAAQNPLVR